MNANSTSAALAAVRAHGFSGAVDAALVLDDAFVGAIDEVATIATIAYGDLPGLPANAGARQGRLVIGKLEKATIACFIGRANYYETESSAAMAGALALAAGLGARSIALVGVARSVNADIAPGSLALITDHINFNGRNPLIGSGDEADHISLVNAYDERVNRRLKIAAGAGGVTLREGVFMWFSGPSYETPAEVRMARQLGADFLGMSTVPEAILARRLGLPVTGFAAITGFAAGFRKAEPDRAESHSVARQTAIVLRRLLRSFYSMPESM